MKGQRKLVVFRWILVGFALVLASGCAVNPVTGKQELSFVSESWEIETGKEQYLPARQMQGGDYVVDPKVQAYVQDVGNRLAAVSDRSLPYEFSVINDATPNAWALPGGKIAVHRGLLTELNNEAELAAVLGHEIVHAAARHGAQGMQRGVLLQGAVLAAGIAAGGSEYSGLAVGGAQVAAGLLSQKYSREAELEADYYGMQYMARANYDPQAAVTLQETFVRLSEGRNSDWLNGLFASHPPSEERVETNRQTARDLGTKGEMGEERYRRGMARILATEKGYAAYEKGRLALKNNHPEEALALAEKALAIEAGEALFYELRGDVRVAQRRYQDAEVNYDRAIERNPEFFRFFLRRGLVRQELGEAVAATNDLEQSVKLLPTAPALNALGKASLAAGNRDTALKYFSAAAGSDSPAGKEATESLVRLDLGDHPERYLKLGAGLDRQGYLVLEVTNTTPLPVSGVEVEVMYPDARGSVRKARGEITRTLSPGSKARIPTGIGPFDQKEALRGMQAKVIRARVDK